MVSGHFLFMYQKRFIKDRTHLHSVVIFFNLLPNFMTIKPLVVYSVINITFWPLGRNISWSDAFLRFILRNITDLQHKASIVPNTVIAWQYSILSYEEIWCIASWGQNIIKSTVAVYIDISRTSAKNTQLTVDFYCFRYKKAKVELRENIRIKQQACHGPFKCCQRNWQVWAQSDRTVPNTKKRKYITWTSKTKTFDLSG